MKFADAQKKMIQYLKSSEFSSREDANTSVSSVPIFEKIIKGGLITENSQEGVLTNGYDETKKKYYRIEERAYVTGFMKEEEARKFVERMNAETNKVAFIVQKDPSAEFEKMFYDGSPISSIPVTVSGSAATRSAIQSLKPFTNLPLVLPTKIVQDIQKNVHLNAREKVELVACIDPVYGRKATSVGGLYRSILKTLEAV